jgi:hypothetical protein
MKLGVDASQMACGTFRSKLEGSTPNQASIHAGMAGRGDAAGSGGTVGCGGTMTCSELCLTLLAVFFMVESSFHILCFT